MYYKEARQVIKDLDRAIDAMSRAQHIIKSSETQTTADIQAYNDIFARTTEVRQIRNTIKANYVGMND